MTKRPIPIARSLKSRPIDTERYSSRLRDALIDSDSRSIQLTHFGRSEQSADLTEPPNFGGCGRIHHFRSDEGGDWPSNPLPIAPAVHALRLPDTASLDAQVFQSAGCNWRCWYCYVPFGDLTGRAGQMRSVASMADHVVASRHRLRMVDLTGGQPDLTPEWPVWMLNELDRRGVDDVYVWSDDNLSTDYFWRYLSDEDRCLLSDHPRYGRACCLKGFDAESFAFNTKADASLFATQFNLLRRLQRETSIDYFLYVTFTTPSVDGLPDLMRSFVDELQTVSEWLPLRTVPLRILEWGPVVDRLDEVRSAALQHQFAVVDAWRSELFRRFGMDAPPRIVEVPR